MAESLGTIYYDVDANLEPLLRSLRRAQDALGGLGGRMDDADQSSSRMRRSLDQTGRSADSLGGQMNGLTRAIQGVIAAMSIREMAGWVQQYQAMAERVEMATRSSEEFEMVQRRLQSTADGTYRSLSEAQELFIRTADSIRDMGYSLDQAIDIQDSMSYAFVTNATSADRAQAAISQFTKAVNTGKVSADQWETISGAIPTIMNDIADATGGSASEVRALGAAGKLAAQDLTEGLRKSLDETRAAADGMGTDLTDAGVRVRNALTTVLVALEEQTGGIQMVTDGIIAASEAMLEFGQDAEKMESFLNLATTAAASLAAVIAGRVVMAVGAYTVAQVGALQSTMAKMAADRASTEALVRRTSIEKQAALQSLRTAQAEFAAAQNTNAHRIAKDALTAAQNRYMAATTAAAAAQAAANRVITLGTIAANGLRTALAFLGGPVGIILLVAAAFLTMGKNAKLSADELDNLGDTIGELGQKTLEYRKVQLEESLRDQEEAAAKAERKLKAMERQLAEGLTRSESFRRKTKEVGAQMEEARANADSYANALNKVNAELERRASGADVGPQRPEDWKPTSGSGGSSGSSEEFRKLEQSMKNQIELAKRTGAARAELAALQRLGADATDEEKARVSELAKELYKLEQAQKKSSSSTKSAAKGRDEAAEAAKSNAKALADLREQLYQTTLDADELVQRQAELTLNEYATPEQREQIRALALELRQANEAASDLARRKQAFGDDVGGKIRGSVQPLSGGMLDDQYARYEAEAVAEQERYAAQLERLREAKELELDVLGGYQALEEQMAQEHADRLMQIENAKNQVMLKAGEQGFGAMAGMMKQAFGEQSAAYKIAFAAQKAFAIAQSIMAIQQGIAMAAANPWPTNLAAMASVAAATAGLVANISSVTMSGGRLAGGPVSAGRMYRVNENGAPEVFSAANGQQFMIPNQRGEVISNRNAAAGGGGVSVVVNLNEDASRAGQVNQSTGTDEQTIIDIFVSNIMSDGRAADALQSKYGVQTQGR